MGLREDVLVEATVGAREGTRKQGTERDKSGEMERKGESERESLLMKE